jgi:hypothetical protein
MFTKLAEQVAVDKIFSIAGDRSERNKAHTAFSRQTL